MLNKLFYMLFVFTTVFQFSAHASENNPEPENQKVPSLQTLAIVVTAQNLCDLNAKVENRLDKLIVFAQTGFFDIIGAEKFKSELNIAGMHFSIPQIDDDLYKVFEVLRAPTLGGPEGPIEAFKGGPDHHDYTQTQINFINHLGYHLIQSQSGFKYLCQLAQKENAHTIMSGFCIPFLVHFLTPETTFEDLKKSKIRQFLPKDVVMAYGRRDFCREELKPIRKLVVSITKNRTTLQMIKHANPEIALDIAKNYPICVEYGLCYEMQIHPCANYIKQLKFELTACGPQLSGKEEAKMINAMIESRVELELNAALGYTKREGAGFGHGQSRGLSFFIGI